VLAALAVELRFVILRVGARGWLLYAFGVFLFGYLVPARYGLDFLDVVFLLAYGCLPGLFVSPMAAEAVNDDASDGSPGVTFAAQVLAPAIFAWVWGLVLVLIGIVVVNSGNMRFVWPNPAILFNTWIFGAAMTLLASAATGWMTLHSKNRHQAKNTARRAYLLLLLAIVIWARYGPRTWRDAVDRRLTADGIWLLLLPAAAVLLLVAALLIRAGRKFRQEQVAGPLFKL
jgi:hypothetical protein